MVVNSLDLDRSVMGRAGCWPELHSCWGHDEYFCFDPYRECCSAVGSFGKSLIHDGGDVERELIWLEIRRHWKRDPGEGAP